MGHQQKHHYIGYGILFLLLFMALTSPVVGVNSEAELFAANITYPVEGGLLYFDAKNGSIEDCDTSVTSAEIPSSIYGVDVTKIGTSAFLNCNKLTSVVIPESVSSIGSIAFSGCSSLVNVRIPSSVTDINGFGGCTSLISVMIPKTVTNISTGAFNGCTMLRDIYYEGTFQEWLDISIGTLNNSLISANIHFESDLSALSSAPVKINSVTIMDISGKTLSTIPADSFLASVSVTSLSSLNNAMVFFAAYTSKGQFVDSMCAFVEASPGATVKVTLPFDNALGVIAQIKAVAVTSYDMALLCESASFPVS